MALLSILILGLILLGIIALVIFVLIKKGASGIKIMILGISISIFGGIFVVDPTKNISGIEYIIPLLGLIISIIGYGKSE